MSSEKGTRTRSWTCILYPDSLPIDFNDRLINSCVPMVLSPLHDPDSSNVNPEEQRKPHYHLGIFFDSVKTKDQVKQMLFDVLGTGYCSPMMINSSKAMIRYFIHADQPEKQQFPNRFDALTCYSGFKLDDFLVPSSSEKSKLLDDMTRFIDDNVITEFSDFARVARNDYYDSWWYLLINGSMYFIQCYINSVRNSKKAADAKEEQFRKELKASVASLNSDLKGGKK